MGKSRKQNPKGGETNNKLIHLSLDLYASFYPKYYYLETTLKNRIYSLISDRLGENWFNDQINSSREESLIKIEAFAILRRKPKGFVLKDKGLLVESGLGIWVEFFNKTLYKEVKGLPILIFPKLPANIKRKELYQKLTKVKELRNLLFHYRIPPVTKSAQLKDLNQLLDANTDLINLLKWLDISFPPLISIDFDKKVKTIRKTLA